MVAQGWRHVPRRAYPTIVDSDHGRTGQRSAGFQSLDRRAEFKNRIAGLGEEVQATAKALGTNE